MPGASRATSGPAARRWGPRRLIDAIDPDYIVLVGVCYGLRPDYQTIGDVLVSNQLRLIDHRRVDDVPDGGYVETQRGPSPEPSQRLLAACHSAADLGWTGPTVHFGQLLCGSAFVNAETYRNRLLDANPDAIGGEMEGGGVYRAATRAGIDWIVIKAICDFAADKTYEYNASAAGHAADFLVHVIGTRALDRR